MLSPESYYLGALKSALEGNLAGALDLQEKAEEARETFGYSYAEPSSNEFPFIEEAVTTLLTSYDFTRCVRPNGTSYGTGGKCQKGVEQDKPSEAPFNPRSSLMGQASHPRTFSKKLPEEVLRGMSDKDLQIRRHHLKGASGYIGYSKDVELLNNEIERRG